MGVYSVAEPAAHTSVSKKVEIGEAQGSPKILGMRTVAQGMESYFRVMLAARTGRSSDNIPMMKDLRRREGIVTN